MTVPVSRALIMALFPGVLTLVLACSDNPAGPAADQPPVAASVTAGGPQVLKGEIGPGALYGLYLPADWNGEGSLSRGRVIPRTASRSRMA
jgi:hypothetical protein